MKRYIRLFSIFTLLLAGAVSCSHIDSNRIPYAPVKIPLDNDGLWTTYGVSGQGTYSKFIKPDVPSRSFYSNLMYTGYGGVLLISNSHEVPCAYDLSCPVEAKQNIRIFVNNALEAECPNCGSRYNILLGDGGPISGPAVEKQFGLQRYTVKKCQPSGYTITRGF